MLDLRDRKENPLVTGQFPDVSFGFDNWIMNPGILKVIFIQIAYVPSHHILTQRVLEDTHTKSHNLTPGYRRLSVIRECCSCWTNIFLYFLTFTFLSLFG